MPGLPEMVIDWKGRPYRCRPSMNALINIENRVTLQKLAKTMVEHPQDIPISHVCWVIFCLLEAAGAMISADDVLDAVKGNQINDQTIANILRYVLAEVYGTAPEVPIASTGSKKKPRAKA